MTHCLRLLLHSAPVTRHALRPRIASCRVRPLSTA